MKLIKNVDKKKSKNQWNKLYDILKNITIK